VSGGSESLVKIGSVVLEKIFFKLHPPFFLFLAWQPPWLEVGITGHKFGRGPPKDHFSKGSLEGPLPKMCLVIPTSNKDGHQAKNRKKGDEI
jgi:hypothetical protein